MSDDTGSTGASPWAAPHHHDPISTPPTGAPLPPAHPAPPYPATAYPATPYPPAPNPVTAAYPVPGYPDSPVAPPTGGVSVTPGAPALDAVGDEITIGGRVPLIGEAEPTRRRGRVAIIASGLALTLVAGVAVAAAWVWNGWGATMPEEVMPGSVVAFARVDLSPGLGQAMKLTRLVQKFPKQEQDKDVTERATQDLIDDLGLDPLTYQTDIKPWFGNRLGVAAWPRGASARDLCVLYALATTNGDDVAASSALAKVQSRRGAAAFGFATSGDYILAATCAKDSQGAADAAVAEAAKLSLATTPAFADVLDSLPSGQLIVAWADFGKALPVLFGAAQAEVSGLPLDAVQGQVVLGVAPTGDGLEVRYRVRGGAGPAGPSSAGLALAELPGNTLLGVSADLRQQAKNLTGLGESLGSGLAGALGGGGISFGDEPIDAPAGEPDDCILNLDENSTPEEVEACLGKQPSLGTGLSPECEKILGDPDSDLADVDKCFADNPTITGPAVPKTFGPAVEALLRSTVTVALTDLTEPALRFSAAMATSADAEALSALFASAGNEANAVTTGTTLTVTTGAYLAGSGRLGDDARYQRAMTGGPANAVFAFYADIEKIAAKQKLTAEQAANLKPVKAVGGTIGYDGTDAVALIRVLID